MRYDEPFSILLLHDLVLALGRDEIQTTGSLTLWLNQNRHKFPLSFQRAVLGEAHREE